MGTLGSRLNSAVRAYNETVGSYEARVLPAARRFADHGAVAEGRELPEIEQVTVSARSVHAAELATDGTGNGSGSGNGRRRVREEDPWVEQLTLPPRRLRAAEQ
jgi:DNA recombination protein RmuC